MSDSESVRKATIRQFHEERARQLYATEEEWPSSYFTNWDSYIIASLKLNVDEDQEPVGIAPELCFSEDTLPIDVAQTFKRHCWYSQYNLADVFCARIPIDDQDSFAILAEGFFGDGWDNGGSLLEIFDAKGTWLNSCFGEVARPKAHTLA